MIYDIDADDEGYYRGGRILDLARQHNNARYVGATEVRDRRGWYVAESNDRVQEGADLATFKEVGRIKVGETEYRVGEDLHLYAPFEGIGGVRGLERASKDGGKTLFEKPTRLPPIEQMLTLYEGFFSKYDREVMVFWGWDRTKPDRPLFMIPKQTGTSGSVEWDDKRAMAAFVQRVEYAGTIHVHPGMSNTPSWTDYGNWKKDGGLHFIWARNRTLNVTASDCRHYQTWDIPIPEGTKSEPVKYFLSPSADKGSLDSLLGVPNQKETRIVHGSAPMPVQSSGVVGRQVERGALFSKPKHEDSEGKDKFLAEFLKETAGPPLSVQIEGYVGLTTGLLRNVYGAVFGPCIPFMLGSPAQKLPVCIMSVTEYQRFRDVYKGVSVKPLLKLARQLRSIRTCP